MCALFSDACGNHGLRDPQREGPRRLLDPEDDKGHPEDDDPPGLPGIKYWLRAWQALEGPLPAL